MRKTACDNFYKSHSQMMTVTLDITDLTPVHVVSNTLLLRLRERRVLWQKHKSIVLKKRLRLRRSREIDAAEDDLDRENEIEMIELMDNNIILRIQ